MIIANVFSQIFVFLLYADAAYVSCGLLKKRNMWKWIILYWVLLTCKNLIDLISNLMA